MGDFKDDLVKNVMNLLKGIKTNFIGRAADFPEDLPWINTQKPLNLEKLKGHVILLDFWTYCCINCIHVLEDLKYLEEKYKDEPFIVIGVHSAKFKNEKDVENIKSAVSRYQIKHPVLVDNELQLWKAYNVNAWPSMVLIGSDGKIMGKVSGEGNRDFLDNSIEDALDKGKTEGILAEKRIEIIPDVFIESFLQFPGKIDIDAQSNTLFISDSNHDRILQVKLQDNEIGDVIKTIGEGRSGFKDGNLADARFNKPQGIVFKEGVLYVADTENHAIRKIDLSNESVSTIAGTGKQGFTRKYSGNPLKVSLSSPWDLEIQDNQLYIAMAGTHQIWKLDLKENVLEHFAGSGIENIIDGPIQKAALAQPSGLTLDARNNRLYFADSEVSALRYVDFKTQEVRTIIGKGLFNFGMRDGEFGKTLLQHPLGLDILDEKIYIADTYNHAIRMVDLNKKITETLIYRPKKGICKIGNEDCDVLPLYEPNDVKIMGEKLYIADSNNHLIRVFDLNKRKLSDLYLS